MADLEARLDAGAKQWARAQQEQAEKKSEWERQERLLHQLRSELQARGPVSDSAPSMSRQPSTHGQSSAGPSTSRSESSDSLFSARDSSDVKKALAKADETHLEHVSKLMRNFEQRVAATMGERMPAQIVMACERLGIGPIPHSLLFEVEARRYLPTDRPEPYLVCAGTSNLSAVEVLESLRVASSVADTDEAKEVGGAM